jgi:putative ABC transport system permease protein
VLAEDSDSGPLVTAATLARLDPGAQVTSLWLQLEPGADPQDAVLAVKGEAGEALTVGGSAEERASFDRVIDTLLLVVTGLLAVAVVIAVIGLANTLSLSELERRRESSLLRSLGLTRGQLRATLALEAVLVAVVGALLGLGLGVAYGLAGAATVLGGAVQSVQPDLPWTQLLVMLVLAVLAGLTASYLPGRRAAGVPPAMTAGE